MPSPHFSVATPTACAIPTVARPSLSLVLPAYNEEAALPQAVAEADEALRRLTDDYEIIVVNDGSRDRTAAVAARLLQEFPALRIVEHPRNQGYGAALRSGFGSATKELVLFTDADCQFDLRELDRLVFLARDYDIVSGYRIDRKDNWLRCLYSRVYNMLVRTLLGTGLRDIDCALKCFRRSALQHIQITTSGFLVNSEVITTARQQGLSIVEVGVSHRPRVQGVSTVSPAHIPRVLTSLARFWWSGVAFHEPRSRADQSVAPPASRRSQWATLGLVVMAMVMLLTNLSYPLIDHDETRYAEIPREMLVTGDWVVPHLNFKTYFDKPPLFYWLCASSYRAFGISEYSARLVPAGAAFCLLVATWFLGRRIFSWRVANIASMILLLSIGFVFCGRFMIIDMVLALFVTIALWAAWEATRDETFRWNWWLTAATACGLGLLTKGPIALVLMLPPWAAWMWLNQWTARVRWHHLFAFGAVAGCWFSPWILAMIQREPTFLHEFFYKHHLARFAGAFHENPWWFYIPVVLIGGHPWSFMLYPYTRFLLSRRAATRAERPRELGYLLLWATWCCLFFTLSKGKLPAYVLPAAPALALLIGHYLELILFRSCPEPSAWLAQQLSPRMAAITSCIALLALSSIAWVLQLESSWLWIAETFLWSIVLIAVTYKCTRKIEPTHAWVVSAILSLLMIGRVMHGWIPALGETQAVVSSLHDNSVPSLHTETLPLVTYGGEWSGIPFYLHRNDVTNFVEREPSELARYLQLHPNATLVVDRDLDLQRLQASLGIDVELERQTERGLAAIVQIRARGVTAARSMPTETINR